MVVRDQRTIQFSACLGGELTLTPGDLPCLGTAYLDGTERAVFVDPAAGVVQDDLVVDRARGASVLDILTRGLWAEYADSYWRWRGEHGDSALVPIDEVSFAAPYRHPRMIWGIGLNYLDHASDLAEKLPEEPASFIKADHTVIGPGEVIPLPWQSERVTAEAELGLVIGSLARRVSEEDALDFVAGVVPILDQTAEDILQRNPRFLTRAKNFPGFFSFGPWITPLSAFDTLPDLSDVEVHTVSNGHVHRSNTVENMAYSPRFLVSFHSEVMPLFPGDIISTGTPGAVVIHAGDVVECRIGGLPTLANPVE